MQDCDKTKEQLIEELAHARQRIATLEATEVEREKCRKDFRTSEARFGALIDKCPLGILVADPRTRRFVMANPKASAMLGYTQKELVQLSVESIHPRGSLPHITHEFDRMVSGESKQSPPLPVLCKDGSLRHVIVNTTLLEIGGHIRLLGFFTDITELKRAEEALRESEDRFRLLVENAGDAIYLANETGRLLDVNPEAERQTGYSREELLAFNLLDLDLNQTPESLGGFISWIRDKGKAFFETLHRRKDGSALPVELRAVRLDLSDRMLLLGIARDITERNRVADTLVQTEKMASVGALAAGMAHEINNPLGGIMQSAQVLAMRLRPDAPANLAAAGRVGCPMEALQAYFTDRQLPQLMEDIRESARRAAAIVSNMIEFSEVGSSAWLPIDLNVVAEKSIELCEQDYNLLERYDTRHISIIREYSGQELNAPCSANQMQQVLFNLLRNAAQALVEAQTPEPFIILRTRKEDNYAVIEVEDNGPGMDEATRKRIFEPFFTTKGPDKGTGLGLSVSYFIVVNRHFGTITVQAAPGGGTRFVIRLPLERVAPAQGLAGGRSDRV